VFYSGKDGMVSASGCVGVLAKFLERTSGGEFCLIPPSNLDLLAAMGAKLGEAIYLGDNISGLVHRTSARRRAPEGQLPPFAARNSGVFAEAFLSL
jgi:hypothetical protein